MEFLCRQLALPVLSTVGPRVVLQQHPTGVSLLLSQEYAQCRFEAYFQQKALCK